MRNDGRGVWAAAILGLVILAGCSTPQSGARGINDGSASLAIKSRLLRSDYNFSGLDVTVVDGLALLAGNVPDAAAKEEAGRIAWSAPNVRDVANELAITEHGRSFFGANDQFITTQVRSRLTLDREVRGSSVHIETHNGVVYLLGRARTTEEARRIAGHASLASGVKRVVSFIRADDASIGVNPVTEPYDPFRYEVEGVDPDGDPRAEGADEPEDELLGGPGE